MKRKSVFIAAPEGTQRDLLVSLIQQDAGLVLAAVAAPGPGLGPVIEQERPALLILSLQGEQGFQPLQDIGYSLPTIFLSADPTLALPAFHYTPVDFILQPAGAGAVRRALHKFQQWNRTLLDELLAESAPLTVSYPRKILVEAGNKRRSLDVSSILYLKAERDYTWIYGIDKQHYLSSFGISELERRLDPAQFLRIHRSYLINTDYIKELYKDISKTFVLLQNDVELSIGRRYLAGIRELVF